MDANYKGHHIQTCSVLDRNTKRWSPAVIISWHENATTQYRQLQGPVDQYDSKEEADNFAGELAKKWIDDGKPDLRK